MGFLMPHTNGLTLHFRAIFGLTDPRWASEANELVLAS